MTRSIKVAAFLVAIPAMMTGRAQAQLPTLVRTINSPAPLNASYFSFAFGAFNGKLLVGTPDFSGPGVAYLMDIDTGGKLLTMTSPDVGNGALSFGRSVAQVGQNIVVGDSEYDAPSAGRSGSAYVFSGTTGQLLSTIRNPNPQLSAHFGGSIAEIGGNIWINSQSESGGASGKVYIFNPNGQLLKTLASPEPAGFWGFGKQFVEHGNDVFVSAQAGSFGKFKAGAVFRYDKNSLDLLQKIYSPAPNEEGYFGWAMTQDNNRLLVGSPGYNSSKNYAVGRAYLFSERTGVLMQTFVNPEPQDFADFGKSLALVGNYAFIGGGSADLNPGVSGPPQNVGAFYVFDVTSGTYLGRVVNPQPEQNDQFTLGTGMNGGLIAIGDKLVASSFLHGNGSAFVYSIPGTAPNPVLIPEPSSLVLLVLGSIGVAVQIRRRKKSGMK
jgi:hypothetical protein